MKCSLLFLLIPLFAFGGNDGEKVEKKISREFSIQSDGRVEIHNKYGNVDIAIGKDHQVKMDVFISASAGSERKAQETLDRIAIEFEEGNNRISALTEIESTSGWLSWFSTGKTAFQIRYQVWVPADVFLELSNKYGAIYVETTNRDLEIELAFGELHLGDINGRLKLDMAYSEGNISQIGDGNMVFAFSDMEMEDGKDISMDIKFSKVKSGTFQNLSLVSANSDLHAISIADVDYDGKYDELIFERVNKIHAESSFTNIFIHELLGESEFDMRYGELKVYNIHREFTRLNINSSYTGAELKFISDAGFSVDAQTNYCDIKTEGLTQTENTDRSGKQIYKATRGNGNGQIMARMNYGQLYIK